MKNKTLVSTILSVSLILIPVSTLSGCLNLGSNKSTTTTSTDSLTKVYNTNEFSIKIPKDWEIIEKKDFTSAVPAETQVVFRNNVKNETFTGNLNIVKKALQEDLDTTEFAKQVFNRQKSGLIDYKEIRRDDIKLTIGGKETTTYFIVYEARRNADEKVIRFLQSYGVKNKSAFIITGAINPKDTDTVAQNIETAIKSFQIN